LSYISFIHQIVNLWACDN